jgi:hypothetical protein
LWRASAKQPLPNEEPQLHHRNRKKSEEDDMSDEATKKPDLKLVPEEELDEEELEFRSIRKDLPGVKGASAVGVVTIAVGKTPGKNEFFRSNEEFRPVVPMVDVEVGMEKQSRRAHPFNAVIDMIVRSASSYLRDKGETTAIRHATQGSSPRDSSPAYRINEHAHPHAVGRPRASYPRRRRLEALK